MGDEDVTQGTASQFGVPGFTSQLCLSLYLPAGARCETMTVTLPVNPMNAVGRLVWLEVLDLPDGA